MPSLGIAADATLILDGSPMPRVLVQRTEANDGAMTLDSQQHEGGTGADHVFDGFADWSLKLHLLVSEERDGDQHRYRDLAAIVRAHRKLSGELPAVYQLTGAMPAALGMAQALITRVGNVRDSVADDSMRLTVCLLEVDPSDSIVQAQAAEQERKADDRPPPAPALTDDDAATLESLEELLLDA